MVIPVTAAADAIAVVVIVLVTKVRRSSPLLSNSVLEVAVNDVIGRTCCKLLGTKANAQFTDNAAIASTLINLIVVYTGPI